MEFEVVRGSSLGFYARKNAIPTMTLNDVKDVITGFKDNSLHRQTRSIVSTVTIGFCDQPPSEGLRSLKPARPLKQESGYSDRVVAKARG